MSRRTILLIVLFLVPIFVQAAEEDAWQPLRFFLGKWEGRGEGKSGISKTVKDFQFVLQEKFIQMRTKAVFESQEKNPQGEVHEDWGLFSYDRTRRKIIFRQFHVEGFINQYILENAVQGEKILVFLSEHIENGPPGLQAKLILRIIDANTYKESFELAFPGKEFTCFTLNVMKRKSEE